MENTQNTAEAVSQYTSLWEARDALLNQFVGYLITEPGNINRVIAMVPNLDEDLDPAQKQTCEVAQEVDHDHEKCSIRPCIDLRHYGNPDSAMPMPGWVYGLACYDNDEDWKAFGSPQTPNPFCRFRLSAMQKHAEKIGWVRREAMPVDHPDEAIWAELHNWADVIERTSPGHPLLAKLKTALTDHFPGFDRFDSNTGANTSLMRSVRNEIVRSKDSHKLLNDWTPDSVGPDPQRLYAILAGAQPYQFLTIVPEHPGTTGSLGCLEYQLAEFEASPVVIRVLEGTSLDDARSALLEADRYMAAHWLHLIRGFEEIEDEREPGGKVRTLDGAARFPADPLDMWTELERWERVIRKADPSSDILKVVSAAIEWDEKTQDHPDIEKMREARQQVLRMYEHARRHALNGWEVDPAEPDRGAIEEMIANRRGWDVIRVLTIKPLANGNMGHPTLETIADTGTTAPVVVHIQEGSTLQEVNTALAELMCYLESFWPSLIRGEKVPDRRTNGIAAARVPTRKAKRGKVGAK